MEISVKVSQGVSRTNVLFVWFLPRFSKTILWFIIRILLILLRGSSAIFLMGWSGQHVRLLFTMLDLTLSRLCWRSRVLMLLAWRLASVRILSAELVLNLWLNIIWDWLRMEKTSRHLGNGWFTSLWISLAMVIYHLLISTMTPSLIFLLSEAITGEVLTAMNSQRKSTQEERLDLKLSITIVTASTE